MQKYKKIDELINNIRKISYRMMNLHKIYSFKLINLEPSLRIDNSLLSDVRKLKDVEDSKILFANIILRCESIVYFFIIMETETILENGEHNQIKNSIPFDNKLNRIFIEVSRIYLFLFDSIINQIISLFDYIANSCSYILIGQQARKYKWKKSLQEIKKKEFSDLALCLNKINNEFIDSLQEIRADIFHYNFINLSSKLSQNLKNGSVKMEFKIDKKIQNFLIKSKLIPENSENIETLDATFLITKISFENVIKILEELKKSIYKINLEKFKQPKPISNMFINAGFKTLSDLQKALFYHLGFFWDDTVQFEKLDYMNREKNKMFMPFIFYPEE